MDENDVTQPYYITTKSSPADDHAHVLKYAGAFAVFDRAGDIQAAGLGEQGLFCGGTRHVSQLRVFLWNAPPLPLSAAVESDNFLFTADLANLDVTLRDGVNIPRGTVHLRRSKFLWRDTCYEEFAFVNYGLSALDAPFSLTFAADFADIFEVRGMHRQRKGQRLEDQVEEDGILLSYQGLDDKVRCTRVQCDPWPQRISGSKLEFYVHLQPREKVVFHLQISCGSLSEATGIDYRSAIDSARKELQLASEGFPDIRSSNSDFSAWVRRSTADVEMMIIGNPEVNYPYAGVPWFNTVFGRDGIITALQTLWLNPSIAKGVLEYLAATQARELNPEIEAEPGKILHETRTGEMAALGEVPFGRYYGSVDSTPLFIILAGAYYDRTGDRDFVKHLWPHIDLALQWLDTFGDLDGDGFLEYARHSRKGLVQQGWKDSNDSIFHADGRLAEAPIAVCEVQGYLYAAKLAAARLGRVLGTFNRSDTLEAEAEKLRLRFEEAFWCDDISTYALALDGHKEPCRVRTSNAGQCLFTGIASPEKARALAETLLSPESFSGWGVRTVAKGQPRYNPLSYHNGSIWPHDNSLIASGLAKYGYKELAGRILLGLLDASRWAHLRRLPELFCGLNRRRGQGPTLYPVACSPQAWAAGSVFLITQACLGISVQSNRIVFESPYLPQGIPRLRISELRAGNGSVDLLFEKRKSAVRVEVLDQRGEVEVSTTTSAEPVDVVQH